MTDKEFGEAIARLESDLRRRALAIVEDVFRKAISGIGVMHVTAAGQSVELPIRRKPGRPPGSSKGVDARHIVHWRVNARMTQQELAVAAGVSRPQISYLERGRIRASQDTIERIAAACGVTASVAQH